MQQAVISRLAPLDQERYFGIAVKMLLKTFPSTWSDDSDGFVYSQWDQCQRCLPHVARMSKDFSSRPMEEPLRSSFVELLLQCAW
jgi:hypothetical protein